MKNKTTRTVKDIVFSDLRAKVNANKAVSYLNAPEYAFGMAMKYGVNPNTIDRARRLYIEKHLEQDLEQRENKAFQDKIDNFKA